MYFAAPAFQRLDDRRIATQPALGVAGGAVRTALVPGLPARNPQGGDPTGCGDVFGATFFSRLLAGGIITDALQAAMVAAARNVEHRGATGLARHLRGELSFS